MLRVTDAPGVYAAFPWGGYAQEKGASGTRSNAIGARALYSPLPLPRIFLHLAVYDRGSLPFEQREVIEFLVA